MTNFERYFNSPNNTAEWFDKITDGCELDSSQCKYCPILFICMKKDCLAYLQKEEYPDTRKGGLEQAKVIIDDVYKMHPTVEPATANIITRYTKSIICKLNEELNK